MARRRLKRSPGGIGFHDDIILGAMENSRFSEKQLTFALHFLTFHIHQEIKDVNRHLIHIPKIGSLLFKVERARHELGRLDNIIASGTATRTTKGRAEMLREKIEIFDEFYERVSKDGNKFSKHKCKAIVTLPFLRHGKSLKEYEEEINQVL